MLKALSPDLTVQLHTVSLTFAMEQYLGDDLPAIQQ